MDQEFSTAARGIDATGATLVTAAVQQLIDEATAAGAPAVISAGTYQVAPLFVGSHAHVLFEPGAVLMGTTDEAQIPVVPTRAAGIECAWYPGVLNINDAEDVCIEGPGTIDGQGPYWWEKYWGADGQGGMRADYDARGLRWACDYDCMRVRNVVVMNSHHVELCGFTSRRSGFWNVHVCYSHDVRVADLTIREALGPSTDGIDIDSSYDVVVEGCDITCNDDSVAIKSGRDADGLRVGRPCHHVVVRDCRINAGFGVTLGSEVSGGIHDITIRDLTYTGTDCGFRIKSSEPRKGYIRDVLVENLHMVDVRYPFHINLDWNPGYSLCYLPEGYDGPVSALWEKLLDKSQMDEPNTQLSNLVVRHVEAVRTDAATGTSRAFELVGRPDAPITAMQFEDVTLDCSEFGRVACVKDLALNGVLVSARGANDERNDSYDDR